MEINNLTEKASFNLRDNNKHKLRNGDSTPLAKRTNAFIVLEKACKEYCYGHTVVLESPELLSVRRRQVAKLLKNAVFSVLEGLKALINILKEIIFRDSKRIYKPQKLSVSGGFLCLRAMGAL